MITLTELQALTEIGKNQVAQLKIAKENQEREAKAAQERQKDMLNQTQANAWLKKAESSMRYAAGKGLNSDRVLEINTNEPKHASAEVRFIEMLKEIGVNPFIETVQGEAYVRDGEMGPGDVHYYITVRWDRPSSSDLPGNNVDHDCG